jgi:DNA-binding response OmpR family regulator
MSGGVGSVLVVDDEPSIRLLCKINLELEGFRVLEAKSLAEARTVLESEPVDAVLLDVHVGGDDGRALLVELRLQRPDVAVAFFTGSADLDQGGADAVITKPFTIEELLETVTALTRGRPRVHSQPSK